MWTCHFRATQYVQTIRGQVTESYLSQIDVNITTNLFVLCAHGMESGERVGARIEAKLTNIISVLYKCSLFQTLNLN